MPRTDGFVMLPNWVIESKLSVWAVSVWVALRYHADQDGVCFPTIEMLSKVSRMSDRQVRYTLAELRDLGLVTYEKKSGRRCVYKLELRHDMPESPAQYAAQSGTVCPSVRHNRPDTPRLTDIDEQDLFNNTQEQDGQKVKKTKSKDHHDERFDEFWKAYPRKVKKKESIKIWNDLRVNGEFDQIMSSLEKFKKSKDWTKDCGEYIPHPTRWLKGRRWEDEIPEPTDPWEEAIKRRDANARL